MTPLVLIPGFMLDHDIWRDIEIELSDVGPMFHPEVYGEGSIFEMAKKILEIAPPEFHLVGFSMGGFVAREVYRIEKQRVKSLVLIATSARGDTEERTKVKQTTLSTLKGFSGVSRSSIKRSLSPKFKDNSSVVERIRAMGLRLGGDVFVKQLSMLRNGDLDRLGELNCPTLIVAGEFDQLRSLQESQELKTKMPNAELKIVPAGHMIPIEKPGALVELMKNFYKALYDNTC